MDGRDGCLPGKEVGSTDPCVTLQGGVFPGPGLGALSGEGSDDAPGFWLGRGRVGSQSLWEMASHLGTQLSSLLSYRAQAGRSVIEGT